MNTSLLAWTGLPALAALCVPVAAALAAAFVSRRDPLARVSRACAVALASAVLATVGWAALSGGAPLVARLSTPRASTLGPAVRLDAVSCAMLLLVCFVGLVVARFSRSYLAGDPGQRRYARSLAATLATVTTLLLSDHLLVLAFAWTATSLALHPLLVFYGDRPAAVAAAHKKFLVSRMADLCVYAAFALLSFGCGAAELGAVLAWLERSPELPLAAHLAAVLLSVGVCLRSAQLPFHGWLTQVMEAPTPVSALLHAGVVNLGGYVLLRLAPLLSRAPAAQALLVVVGSTTAVLAALITSTRVSVKVALAWSTIAQMGFLLVQCGLGAWHLALLHLLAHSLYKAHAFLSSGSAVEAWLAGPRSPRLPTRAWHWLAAASASLALVAAAGWGSGLSLQREPALWTLGAVLGFSLAPLLVRGASKGWRGTLSAALTAAGVLGLYFAWHALASRTVAPQAGPWLAPRVGFSLAAFSALFLARAWLELRPEGALARALYPRLFAGLYLDELFTRATFRFWPPREAATRVAPSASLHTPVRTLEL